MDAFPRTTVGGVSLPQADRRIELVPGLFPYQPGEGQIY
jgi:hypothetical protein